MAASLREMPGLREDSRAIRRSFWESFPRQRERSSCSGSGCANPALRDRLRIRKYNSTTATMTTRRGIDRTGTRKWSRNDTDTARPSARLRRQANRMAQDVRDRAALQSLATVRNATQLSGGITLVQPLAEYRIGVRLRSIGPQCGLVVHPGEDDYLRLGAVAKEQPEPAAAELRRRPVLEVVVQRAAVPRCLRA
jgi:hypothetical protein